MEAASEAASDVDVDVDVDVVVVVVVVVGVGRYEPFALAEEATQ